MEAKTLKILIAEKGVKQTWIATKLGVSKGLVNQWIKDKRPIAEKHQIELKRLMA